MNVIPGLQWFLSRSKVIAACLLIIFFCLVVSTPAEAQATKTWMTSGTGVWATGSNWSGGTAPTNNASTTDIAYFSDVAVGGNSVAAEVGTNNFIAGISFNSAGTTSVQSNSNSFARTLTIGSSGITVTSGAGAVMFSPVRSGTGAPQLTLRLNGSQTWTNNSANTLTIANPVINYISGTTTNLAIAGSGSTTISGVISSGTFGGGPVQLIKQGAGTLTLSAANTYTGATQVISGLLVVNAAGAIPGSSAITLGGATTRGFLEIDAPLTISSLTFSGSGGDVVDTSQSTATFSATSGTATITVLGGSNAFHASATLASPTLLDVSSGAFFTFHNNLSGSAAFTKQGAGTLSIVGDNDGYSGSFNITGGRVNIGSGMNQIGTGTTTLSGGATLDLGGQAFTDRIIVLSGTILNAGGTATTTTISGPTTVSGSTAGTYNITPSGIGTFNAAVGSGTLPVNVNVSSTSAPGGQAIFNNVIAGQGNVVVYGGGTATFNGAVSGATTTHGVSTFNADYDSEAQVQNGGSATFAGTTGASSVVKIFAGGTGTFSNAVSGTVQVWGAATFTSTSSLTGSLTTNSGGVATFADMAATVSSAIHNDGQLIVNRTSGVQTLSGVIDGDGSLVKQGGGLLALTGNNSYSGPTTVSNGILAVNGQIASSVAVASGGTVAGSGLIGGILSGAGLVSPGNSPGILTASEFDPTGGLGAAFEFRSAAPIYTSATASFNDVLRLTDASPFTTSLTGSNVINVYFDVDSIATGNVFEGGFFTGLSAGNLLTAVQDATFQYWIKDNAGGTAFNGVNYKSLSSMPGITGVTLTTISREADFGSGPVSGSVTQFIIVPEPGTLAIAGIGVGIAGWMNRNRRRPRRTQAGGSRS